MSEKLTFRSNGKLLLTGEYVVLDGGKALAIPSKLGQRMEVSYHQKNTFEIYWKAFDEDGTVWIETTIDYKECTTSSNAEESQQLLKIIQHPLVQKALSDLNGQSFQIDTYLEFPKDWGLGTSSTLINNVAEWLDIDAYKLQEDIFGGSGYDIACARYHDPITYQLINKERKIEVVELSEDITKYLYFVYLNQKQNSREAIKEFQKRAVSTVQIDEVSLLTEALLNAKNRETFSSLIEEHNNIISEILDQPSAQQEFIDCPYTLKYLGAWGGDFMMVVGDKSAEKYFEKLGYSSFYNYSQLFTI